MKENFPAVTVLIGLSINGYSRAGVVHNPFKDGEEEVGATYFGTGEHGAYRVDYNKTMTSADLSKRAINYFEPFDHIEGPKDGQSIRVAASL